MDIHDGMRPLPSVVRVLAENPDPDFPLLAGTGWFVDRHLVATSGHGVTDGRVGVQFAPGHLQTVARSWVDPGSDLAVLHVPGLDRPPLEMGVGAPPTGGGYRVVGYPTNANGGVQVTRPASVGSDWVPDAATTRATGQTGNVFHAHVVGGNSGGPLLDAENRVWGTIIKGAAGHRLGLAAPNDALRALLERARHDLGLTDAAQGALRLAS